MEHIAIDIKQRYPNPNRFEKCDNYKNLLENAISELSKITNTDYNQIILLATTEPHSLGLVVFADKISDSKQHYRITERSGLIYYAFVMGSIEYVKDTRNSKIYFPAVSETKSELVVPISNIGVFNSESEEVNHYTDDMIVKITSLLNDFSKMLRKFSYRKNIDMNDIPYIRL
jgi:putative methionine-R-sulfoxide reductase with GAF domain